MRVGGDVITQFNDRPVNQFSDLIAYLERYTEVGDEVELTVLRDGETQTITVMLEGRPGQRILIGGDIIIELGDQAIPDMEALRTALMQASPGDTVTLTVLRDGAEQEIEVTLAELPS